MTPLVDALRGALAAAADPEQASAMRAYMKSDMPFRGVPQPVRARILRECVQVDPPPSAGTLAAVADALWDGAEFREERYLATALCGHRGLAAWPDADWLPRYRHWLVSGAWWDHVDEIASRVVGPALRADPASVTPVLRTWIRAPDRWLRRTAVICQLGAREQTDLALLAEAIEANLDDGDFFLRKGIGWALRQYARTDPQWVRTFVDAHPDLSPLSRREALKHL
jgi:3-methyladenine DNA glycosylase AlkD